MRLEDHVYITEERTALVYRSQPSPASIDQYRLQTARGLLDPLEGIRPGPGYSDKRTAFDQAQRLKSDAVTSVAQISGDSCPRIGTP